MCRFDPIKLLRFQLEQEIVNAEKQIEHCKLVRRFFEQFDEEWTEGLYEAINAIMQIQNLYSRELKKLLEVMDER